MKISGSIYWSKPLTDTHGKCSVEDGWLGSSKYIHSSLSVGYASVVPKEPSYKDERLSFAFGFSGSMIDLPFCFYACGKAEHCGSGIQFYKTFTS